MNRINLSVLLGIGIGFFALIAGFLIEGGSILGLLGVGAIPSEKARREGLLILENDVEGELTDDRYDPLIRKGVSLVVDGTEPELIRDILEQDISGFEEKRRREASIFEAAGGFSPTMGIIGTILGLIQVMTNLKDPSTLGPAIALAFVATLYGIALANLVWLPVANKLKLKVKIQKRKKEMIVTGVLAIQGGDNPRVRAINVLKYLTSLGVVSDRLAAAAYGDTHPMVANDTPEGRAYNRRVEIVILP